MASYQNLITELQEKFGPLILAKLGITEIESLFAVPSYDTMIEQLFPIEEDPKERSNKLSQFESLFQSAKEIRPISNNESEESEDRSENIIVKFIDYVKQKDGMERAMTELEAYSKLDDLQGKFVPEILFNYNSFPFIVIGLSLIVDGVTLDEYSGSMEGIHSQIEDILKLVNARGVYLDVTPRNVLIDRLGKVWLIDFSRARWQMETKFTISNNL